MHTAGASGSDVTELVTVQEEGLLVKDLELSTASCAQAQHVSNSGKDRFTVFTLICEHSVMLPCGKKLIIPLHVSLNVGLLGIKNKYKLFDEKLELIN